ncbi:aldehyde dehydrogenase family protein [archaeon]|nr:MAG: aldehyde dehydrogenase family protein [archaeon]
MTLDPIFSHEAPVVVRKEMGREVINELSPESLESYLSQAPTMQADIAGISLDDRIEVFAKVGALWERKRKAGLLDDLKQRLAASSGYSARLIDVEFSLVPLLLERATLRRNLSSSLLGGADGLERFTSVNEGEYFRHLPAGPVLIISSGNSMIPPLIPTTLSLITGNVTVLKPSLSNYEGVASVFALLREVAETDPAAKSLLEALVISYFSHDSASLSYLLTAAPLGVVNFWGSEPARSVIAKMLTENPSHPSYVVNGPLTGVAVVDAEAGERAAQGLATNIVLYDQQLCSSPTQVCFIGERAQAESFARLVGTHLDGMGDAFALHLPEGVRFSLNNIRRSLLFKGASVLSSSSATNPWTIVITEDGASLDELITSYPEMGIHNRRRFLELHVVNDVAEVGRRIRELPHRKAYHGIDRVQTVGVSVGTDVHGVLMDELLSTGIYRITPIDDMYMRSASEPYDGAHLAALFTYTLYRRDTSHAPDVMP